MFVLSDQPPAGPRPGAGQPEDTSTSVASAGKVPEDDPAATQVVGVVQETGELVEVPGGIWRGGQLSRRPVGITGIFGLGNSPPYYLAAACQQLARIRSY